MGVFTQKRERTGNISKDSPLYYLKRIGASVLFSGAAIGVSHVVQATRAGGGYGLTLIPLILVCLFLKYPTFLIGALYTQATGESVVRGYSKINKYALWLVGFSFLSIMFTVVSAVSMLGTGILIETFDLSVNILPASIGLIIISTFAVTYFSFSAFQNYMKFVFLFLTILTFGALFVSLSNFQVSQLSTSFFTLNFNKHDLFFIAALIGWMPAGLDLPMMHSQWVLENKSTNSNYHVVQDFNFGYLSTAILAIAFLLIGFVFFYGKSVEFSTSAVGFSGQLLNVYRQTFGGIASIPIGLTLFLAIFSTLVVVIDGFPRVLSEVISELKSKKTAEDPASKYRTFCSWSQAIGASVLILIFSSSLTKLVDFATTVSFLLAPIFVYLNHKLISLGNLKFEKNKAKILYVWSFAGLISFSAFTLFYLILKLL